MRGKSAIAVIDRTKQKKTLVDGWLEVSGLAWTAEGNEVWFAGKGEDSGWGIYGTTLSGTVRLILEIPRACSTRRPRARRPTAGQSIQRAVRNQISGGRDISGKGSVLAGLVLVPVLSPDGQWLLFSEMGEAAGSQGAVYLRKTDGSPAVRLGTGGALAFSPDGKWALTMARSRQELALLPVGVGAPRTIPLPANFDRFEAGIWLRDGRLLVSAIEHGHDPSPLPPADRRRTAARHFSGGPGLSPCHFT